MGKFSRYGQNAEDLYVRQGKTLQDISELLGISMQTLSRWKQKYDWTERRRIYRVSMPGTIQILEDVLKEKIEQLRELQAQDVDGKQIDGITKLVASIQKLKREDDLRSQTIRVMSEFSRFIKQKNLKERELDLVINLVQEFFDFVRDV